MSLLSLPRSPLAHGIVSALLSCISLPRIGLRFENDSMDLSKRADSDIPGYAHIFYPVLIVLLVLLSGLFAGPTLGESARLNICVTILPPSARLTFETPFATSSVMADISSMNRVFQLGSNATECLEWYVSPHLHQIKLVVQSLLTVSGTPYVDSGSKLTPLNFTVEINADTPIRSSPFAKTGICFSSHFSSQT